MALHIYDVERALARPVQKRDVAITRQVQKEKLQLVERQQVQKDVTYSASTQYMHGPAGAFSSPGVDPGVISTIYRTQGLSRKLPFIKSRTITPIYSFLSRQGADIGSEPADVCSRGKQPAKLLEHQLTAPFGLIKRSTETFDMTRLGEIINRAEPMDLTIMNPPTGVSKFIPQAAQNINLNSELRMQYFRLGISLERDLEVEIFSGSGTNQNTTQGFKGIYGLDTLINTGKTDLETGGLTPDADSLIVSWASNLISASPVIMGVAQDIVTLLSRVMKYLEAVANNVGFLPALWNINMPYDMFWELTRIWPCSYLTNGCTTSGNNYQFVAANDQIAMRDQMRQGLFLWVNGVPVPVNVTDAIARTAAAAGAKADIYITPMQAGGMNTLYWNYFDFANPVTSEVVGELPTGEYSVTDDGMYMWTPTKTSFCTYFENVHRGRLVLRTPFLGARITNVVYPSILPVFDSIPASIYFQPGGGSAVGSYNPAALYQSTSI